RTLRVPASRCWRTRRPEPLNRVQRLRWAMERCHIYDEGRLFMSAAIHQWNILAARGVDVVIDLEGGLDLCIPTQANQCLYVYFPFDDDDRVLPSVTKLQAVAQLGAGL